MKKILALLMVTLLALSVFAACSAKVEVSSSAGADDYEQEDDSGDDAGQGAGASDADGATAENEEVGVSVSFPSPWTVTRNEGGQIQFQLPDGTESSPGVAVARNGGGESFDELGQEFLSSALLAMGLEPTNEGGYNEGPVGSYQTKIFSTEGTMSGAEVAATAVAVDLGDFVVTFLCVAIPSDSPSMLLDVNTAIAGMSAL